MSKKLNLLSILFITSISVSLSAMEKQIELQNAGVGTQHLLDAIKEHDFEKAKKAIESEEADVNFRCQVTADDYSKTDWTPLMKAMAELCYIMVTSQSRLNGVMLWGSQAIKDEYKKDLENLHSIIKLLLRNPKVAKEYRNFKGRTAASICHHACALLSAQTLIPPYKTRTPESAYTDVLSGLMKELPLSEDHRGALAVAPFFKQNKTFASVKRSEGLPIVFDPNYDISAYGIEKFHPFDAKKYGKVCRILKENLGFQLSDFHTPTVVSDEELALVHTKPYCESLNRSSVVGVLADMDSLGYLEKLWYIGYYWNKFVNNVLVDPVKLATGGTILATRLALKHGWAVNIAGGYHHAKSKELVRGFCLINDLCIAAKKVLIADPHARILIIDLDAHQGNGHEEIAVTEKRIAIFDMYNADTWPGDYPCQERINFDYPLKAKTKDDHYMKVLTEELPKVIDTVKPTLILYNAGTDIYEEDPLGMLSISRKAIVDRDEFVFRESMKRNVPIAMVLSGGYHAQSYSIIGESLTNLWNKLLVKTVEIEK